MKFLTVDAGVSLDVHCLLLVSVIMQHCTHSNKPHYRSWSLYINLPGMCGLLALTLNGIEKNKIVVNISQGRSKYGVLIFSLKGQRSGLWLDLFSSWQMAVKYFWNLACKPLFASCVG